jgi:uncharacterized protein YraI
VTASALNVRSGPATSYGKVGLVYSGNSLTWLGSSSGWQQVRLSNGAAGWVHGNYVSCSGNTAPAPSPSTRTVCVTASALNVRSGPSTGYGKVGIVRRGDRLTVTSSSGSWLRISSPSGWVSGQYTGSCSGTSPSPNPGPAPVPAPPSGGSGSNSDPSMQPSRKVSVGSGLRGTMARIYNEYGRFINEQARALGVDENLLAGVLQIESGGRGFSNGRMIIRFENHVFKRYISASTYSTYFQHNSGKSWTGHKYRTSPSGSWMTFHGDQSAEHRVLNFARGLNNEGAFKSASYGAAQIMGFNHQTCGYSTAQAMYNAFSTSIKAQMNGFISFIRNRCLSQLRSSIESFVACYNGSGQVASYAGKIRNARDAYRAIKP